MSNTPGLERQYRPPSLTRLGGRVFMVLAELLLVLVILWLWLSWEGAKKAELQRMDVTAALAAGQAQNYLAHLDDELAELAHDLRGLDVARHPEAVLPHLRRLQQRHPTYGNIMLILPDGQVAAATSASSGEKLPNVLANPEWREDFYGNLQATGLTVNRPQIGYMLKKWLIPLRYTVRDARGKVSFVFQTSLVLEKQQALWGGLTLPEGMAIGLIRTDGYLISRQPASDPGKLHSSLYANHELRQQLGGHAGSGYFEGMEEGGIKSAGAFYRVQNYPLHAFISLPQAALRQIWWQGVRIPLYLLLALFVLSAAGYGLFLRRFSRRMRIIRENLTSRGADNPLPSSGVREIDSLYEALAETREQLKQSVQGREKMLLSAANAGTYTVRVRDDIVLAADQAFLGMLHAKREEVIGRPWRDLLAGNSAGLNDAAQHSQDYAVAHRIQCFQARDGVQPWLSLAEYGEIVDGEPVMQGLAIDVSERELLLTTVGAQSARLQALWQLATNRARPDRDKIDLMLSLASDLLNAEVALIYEAAGDKCILRHAADNLRKFRVGRECPADWVLCRPVMESGQSIYICDLTAHQELRDHHAVARHDLRMYAGIPIWVDEHIHGALVFLRGEMLQGGCFSEDDQAFMELLAAWFGQILLQQKQRLALENLALTDSLTGLPNRRAAEMRFDEEIARARRDGSEFAIATCDLDRFKLINDHYGHDVGDEVLQQAAQVMREALREGDWVARWGGEEFIVFLHHSDCGEGVTALERIRQALKARPLQTREGGIEVTASFGIGVFRRGDEEDIYRVLSEADRCLYEAKRKGRDCIVASEPESYGTLWKAGMLQHALQDNRVVAAFQVIVDLATNRPVAQEALARLVHPNGTIVAAGDFVEAAEGINLIHAVDRNIARQAMQRYAADLQNGGASPLAHFINLSPQFMARKELVDELLDSARDLCLNHGVEFSKAMPIVLEITERQLVADLEKIRHDLQPLLDFGFRLALDDFGSGYSSFLYLSELPISYLKIEGWMVRSMRENGKTLQVVQSLVALAQMLGITTIAEWVEDRETAEMLLEMGVDWGQGYYFGRPEAEAP